LHKELGSVREYYDKTRAVALSPLGDDAYEAERERGTADVARGSCGVRAERDQKLTRTAGVRPLSGSDPSCKAHAGPSGTSG